MAEVTYLEGIRQALFEEMERDSNVFCMGEDIGAYGGALVFDSTGSYSAAFVLMLVASAIALILTLMLRRP